MNGITVNPSMGVLIARFAAMAAIAELDFGAVILQQKEIIDKTVIPIIQQATPVATGQLAASTKSTITASRGHAEIEITQGATNASGAPYVQWVVLGRGEIIAQPGGALYWEGAAHPVKKVGPQAPNPYLTEASAQYEGPYLEECALVLRMGMQDVLNKLTGK